MTNKLLIGALMASILALTACGQDNKQEPKADAPKAESSEPAKTDTATAEVTKEAEAAAKEVTDGDKQDTAQADEKTDVKPTEGGDGKSDDTSKTDTPADGETAEKKAGENQQY